jgi:hypothetical protein
LRDDSLSQIGVAAVSKRLVATTRKAVTLFGAVALEREYLEQAFSSTASRTVVVGDFHWLDRLAAWALIQGFDEREGEALADCRD